jgi:hypothetical protein
MVKIYRQFAKEDVHTDPQERDRRYSLAQANKSSEQKCEIRGL